MKPEELHKSAMGLPDGERARLAADLLGSLPITLVDPDDGIAEARRRARELEQNPAAGCTWEEIRKDLDR